MEGQGISIFARERKRDNERERERTREREREMERERERERWRERDIYILYHMYTSTSSNGFAPRWHGEAPYEQQPLAAPRASALLDPGDPDERFFLRTKWGFKSWKTMGKIWKIMKNIWKILENIWKIIDKWRFTINCGLSARNSTVLN